MGAKSSKQPPAITEDALEFLKYFDTVLIVDDSRSMRGPLWKEAGQALAELAAVASQYASNGLEIQFLNSPLVGKNIKTAQEVQDLFGKVEPTNSTPIGRKLDRLLNAYLNKLRNDRNLKRVNYIIITDGCPTDRLELEPEAVIVKAAKVLDARSAPLSQIGIQFVQIGDNAAATRYLESLDDSLKTTHHVRDMVDTTPSVPGRQLDMVKILTGGVNRRVDDKGSSSVRY